MMQIARRHAAGTFAPCSGCGREPVHVTVKGSSCAEPVRFTAAERHMLECCPCAMRTGKHASLEGAKREWQGRHGQLRAIAVRPRAVA